MTFPLTPLPIRWRQLVIQAIAVLVLYSLAAQLGSLFLQHGDLTPVWPPAAVVAAAALLCGVRSLIGVVAHLILASLFAGQDLPAALAEPLALLIAASALRYTAQRLRLDLALTSVNAVLLLLALSLGYAFIDATLRTVADCSWQAAKPCIGVGQAPVWLHHAVNDLFGLMICLPALLSWGLRLDPHARQQLPDPAAYLPAPLRPSRTQWRYIASGLLCAGLAWLLIHFAQLPGESIGYLALPLLIWAAFRFQALFVHTAILVVGLATSGLQLNAPTADLAPVSHVWTLFLFLLSASTITLMIAAMVKQRFQAATAEVRHVEQLRLQTIFAAAPEAIVTIDGTGLVRYWNPSAERLFGWQAAEVVGLHIHSFLTPPEMRHRANQGLEAFQFTGEGPLLNKIVEVEGMHALGHRVPIELALTGFREGNDWHSAAFIRDISERRRNEALVMAAELKARDVTDKLPLAVFQIKLNGDQTRATFASSAWRQFGIEPEAVLRDVWQPLALIVSEDLPALRESILDAIKRNEPWEHIFRVRSADLGVRWVRSEARPSDGPDGEQVWNGFWQDITENQRIAKDLERARDMARESRRRLQDLSDALPLAIFQIRAEADGYRNYTFASAKIKDVLGVEFEELYTDTEARWRHVLPEDRVWAEPMVHEALKNHRDTDLIHRVRLPSGVRWIHGHSICSRAPDGGWVWNGFWMDVTDSQNQSVALNTAKVEAEQATQTKSMFLANMSHEIRTPMNAIIGMAHLALKTQLDKRQRDYVDKIHQAGLALLGIINDILDFSKIEAGRLEIDEVDFNLDEVLTHVATVTSGLAQQKALEYLFQVPADIPRAVHGDPLRLGQVLINLINNAIKFTAQGDVRLSAAMLTTTDANYRLQFSVHDTGIGMSAEQVKKLFVAFSQADGSTTRRFGGTGLGLSISKRLVELMGGEMWVESQEGIGSSFHFTVTLGRSAAKPSLQHILPAALNQMRVLIVDDNAVARSVLEDAFTGLPVDVDSVDSGAAALAAILAADADRPYGTVFTDWKMPGMDGVALIQRVKAEHTLRHPPFMVLVTAFGREEVRGRLDVSVADSFLLKPVNRSMLVDTLVNLYDHGETQHYLARSAITVPAYPGKRLLLVEDNDINRQIAAELLEETGATVEMANNGREAVERLQSLAPDHYALVLMDLQMPVMDGHVATALLRADHRFDQLAIIAMTAHAMVEERARCLAAGMQDHVAKPIDPAALYACLRRWLGEPRPAAAVDTPPTLTASVTMEPNLPSIPGLDTAEGLRRLGGKTVLYRRLLAQFGERYGEVAQRIHDNISKDRSSAERDAHTLKGVAGNLGATTLHDLAGQVETLLRDDASSEAINAALPALSHELKRLIAGISQALQGDAVAPQVTAQADPSVAQHLAKLLRDSDSEALDYGQNHAATLRALLGDGYGDIAAALEHYDFDTALRQLSALASKVGVTI